MQLDIERNHGKKQFSSIQCVRFLRIFEIATENLLFPGHHLTSCSRCCFLIKNSKSIFLTVKFVINLFFIFIFVEFPTNSNNLLSYLKVSHVRILSKSIWEEISVIRFNQLYTQQAKNYNRALFFDNLEGKNGSKTITVSRLILFVYCFSIYLVTKLSAIPYY